MILGSNFWTSSLVVYFNGGWLYWFDVMLIFSGVGWSAVGHVSHLTPYCCLVALVLSYYYSLHSFYHSGNRVSKELPLSSYDSFLASIFIEVFLVFPVMTFKRESIDVLPGSPRLLGSWATLREKEMSVRPNASGVYSFISVGSPSSYKSDHKFLAALLMLVNQTLPSMTPAVNKSH